MNWVLVNYTVVDKNETFDVCEQEEKNKKKKKHKLKKLLKYAIPLLRILSYLL